MSSAARFRMVLSAAAALWLVRPSHGLEPAAPLRLAARESANQPAAGAAAPHAPHFVGVASCSAASCHGGSGSVANPVGSEYSLWVQTDPHATAWTVLHNETSRRMARLLKLDQPAHAAPLCLNCHAPQSDPPFAASPGVHAGLLDGVSCESCHGAASEWRGPHVRRDWRQKPAAEREALGFRDLRDLWTRAKLCAECHVGAPGRDVNHDLYAAGHPRLFFELSAFMANLPAHWDRAADRARSGSRDASPFEATQWALGQLASADAALRLLEHRAQASQDSVAVFDDRGQYPAGATRAVWPEFSETACYACHHDLLHPGWRQTRGYAGRPPGGTPWGAWLFPLVPVTMRELTSLDLTAQGAPLDSLRREMARPLPDRQPVLRDAALIRQKLSQAVELIQREPLTADRLEKLLAAVADEGRRQSAEGWDEATQTYLALVALHQGWRDAAGQHDLPPDRSARRMMSSLELIRSHLEFPAGFDSPRDYADESRTAVLNELETVLRMIRQE